MFGAIIRDVLGSGFEFNNIKSKEFELLNEKSSFTDDTVLTVAVAAFMGLHNYSKAKIKSDLEKLYPQINVSIGGDTDTLYAMSSLLQKFL